MSESKGKNGTTAQTRRYNITAVEKLSEKYNLTKTFIRQCLRNERSSQTADQIRKEYKELCDKIAAIS